MTSDAVNGRFVAGCRRLTVALPNFDNSLRQPLQQITGELNRKLAEAGGSSFCSPGELEKSGTSEQRVHIPMEKGGALFPIGASALNSTLSSVGSARSEVLKHHRDIKKAVFGDGFQGLSRSHTKKPGGLSDENCPVIEKSTRISIPAADKGIRRQIAGDLAVVSHGLSRSHTKISNAAADEGISLVSEAATEEMTLSEVGSSEYSPEDLSPSSTKSKIERFGISQVAIEAEFHSVGKLMRICKLAKDQGTARTLIDAYDISDFMRLDAGSEYWTCNEMVLSELQLAKQFVKSSGGLYLKENPVVRFDGEEEEDYWYCYPKFMRLLELDPNLVMDLQSLEETHKNMKSSAEEFISFMLRKSSSSKGRC